MKITKTVPMYFIYVLKNIKTSNNVFNYLQIQSGVGDKINRIRYYGYDITFHFHLPDTFNKR
ncbi:MAG: hypothetical protein ACYCSW_09550 [bacterium]